MTSLAAAETAESRGVEDRTELFLFASDERINLHHFLVHWASAEAERRPPWAGPLVERQAGLGALSEAERDTWQDALDAYAAAVGRNFLFDEGLLAVRDALAGLGSREAVPEADRPLLAAVDEALPVYRSHWWPDHDRLNREWIDALVPLLGKAEVGISRRLTAAYGGRWPEAPVRIDVVAYANWVGAYSTGGLVTIASGDEEIRMPQAVEMVFHESSHLDSLESPLLDLIERAFAAEGRPPPGRFWHDLIFFTSGEATRLELAMLGLPDYRHYGSLGVYRRGERWPPQLEALAAHWRPFLESGSAEPAAREAALRAVVRALPATELSRGSRGTGRHR